MNPISLRAAFAVLVASALLPLAPAHAEAAKPNIILVMPDDTGYGGY
jgi:ABC-type sugar transport system substrate-binding protein